MQYNITRIAVLLTTFNRRDKTLSCLKSLYAQNLKAHQVIEVFLTDDESRDQTKEAIKQSFPTVHIFPGTGQLYWAGGMRVSWNEALKHDFDYYLLLNDDTVLHPDALSTLVSINEENIAKERKSLISIGCTSDTISGKISYGGKKLISPLTPRSIPVFSEKEKLECDLGNANIMLVPKEIVDTIGILSDEYTHGIADYDYTLMAKKSRFKVIVAPGILGSCTDDHGKNWQSHNIRIKERIKYLYSPKGLAYKEYLFFIRKHFPFHLPSAFIKLWLKTLFPFIYDVFKK